MRVALLFVRVGVMPSVGTTSGKLIDTALALRARLAKCEPGPSVRFVYNPLDYAWAAHRAYLERFGSGPKEVLMVGMNPGPWGMAQTGIPFGEVSMVRDWIGITGVVSTPTAQHPRVPVKGFDCGRSEVSGRRLWGWAKDRFGTAEHFFSRFFVANYCPLMFLDEQGRNVTPEKLPAANRARLQEVCDQALAETVQALNPRLVVGVGAFAEARVRSVVTSDGTVVGGILHPSPASPVANRGWARQAETQLRVLGLAVP